MAFHLRRISWCQSTANHCLSEAAMMGPTPSTAASSPSVACSTRSIERNSRASASAATGPTCRMDRPVMIRASGRSFAAAMFSSIARAFFLGAPSWLAKTVAIFSSPVFGSRLGSPLSWSRTYALMGSNCSMVRSKRSPSSPRGGCDGSSGLVSAAAAT